MRLAGDLIGDVDEHGEPIVGDTLLLLLNAHHEPIPFRLPATKPEHHWERASDTAEPSGETVQFPTDAVYSVPARSLCVLRTKASPVAEPAGHQVRDMPARSRRSGRRRRDLSRSGLLVNPVPDFERLLRETLAELAHDRLPESTYRLQFHSEFRFDQATAFIPYLADLGVTDCYASPLLLPDPEAGTDTTSSITAKSIRRSATIRTMRRSVKR